MLLSLSFDSGVSDIVKETAARIKINELLEAAGWRFFPEGKLPATSSSRVFGP
jgi:hypothetical protein